MEFRTQPMIEAALREARQEAAQEAPQPERTEQQDAACGMLPASRRWQIPLSRSRGMIRPSMQRRSGPCAVPCFRGWTFRCAGRRTVASKRYAAARPAGAGLRRSGAWRIPRYASRRCQSGRAVPPYSGLYAQAAAAWEAENGPIVQRSAVGESGYDWLRGPWPWQYAANDGEGLTMFVYEKKLQYPVRIKNTNPKLASIIISQYGGPNGELGAAPPVSVPALFHAV